MYKLGYRTSGFFGISIRRDNVITYAINDSDFDDIIVLTYTFKFNNKQIDKIVYLPKNRIECIFVTEVKDNE